MKLFWIIVFTYGMRDRDCGYSQVAPKPNTVK